MAELTPLQRDAIEAAEFMRRAMVDGAEFHFPTPGVQRWLDALREWLAATGDRRLDGMTIHSVISASADFCCYLADEAKRTVH